MMMNRVKGVVTRMVLAVILLVGFVAFIGTTAQAQGRHGFHRSPRASHRVFVRPRFFLVPRAYPRGYWYHHGFSPYYYPSSHVTEGQGYHDGLDDGKDDAEDGKAYDPYRHKDYKNGMTSEYLNGYLRGYADGYRRG
jgi:hypothetical protein